MPSLWTLYFYLFFECLAHLDTTCIWEILYHLSPFHHKIDDRNSLYQPPLQLVHSHLF